MSKATYRFNCSNGFDHKTGDCLFGEFRDVSHFGCREEEFRDRVEEGLDGFLTFDEFISLCQNEQWINPGWEFYFYPGSETEYQVYVAYDPDEDIHYFFSGLHG